jgi:hypothetical protein
MDRECWPNSFRELEMELDEDDNKKTLKCKSCEFLRDDNDDQVYGFDYETV